MILPLSTHYEKEIPVWINRCKLKAYLDAAEGCEAGHFVAAVYGIAGIGYVFQTGEYVGIAAYAVGQFHIEERIVLMLYVIGHIEAARAFKVGGNLQPVPKGKFSSEIILVFRRP